MRISLAWKILLQPDFHFVFFKKLYSNSTQDSPFMNKNNLDKICKIKKNILLVFKLFDYTRQI